MSAGDFGVDGGDEAEAEAERRRASVSRAARETRERASGEAAAARAAVDAFDAATRDEDAARAERRLATTFSEASAEAAARGLARLFPRTRNARSEEDEGSAARTLRSRPRDDPAPDVRGARANPPGGAGAAGIDRGKRPGPGREPSDGAESFAAMLDEIASRPASPARPVFVELAAEGGGDAAAGGGSESARLRSGALAGGPRRRRKRRRRRRRSTRGRPRTRRRCARLARRRAGRRTRWRRSWRRSGWRGRRRSRRCRTFDARRVGRGDGAVGGRGGGGGGGVRRGGGGESQVGGARGGGEGEREGGGGGVRGARGLPQGAAAGRAEDDGVGTRGSGARRSYGIIVMKRNTQLYHHRSENPQHSCVLLVHRDAPGVSLGHARARRARADPAPSRSPRHVRLTFEAPRAAEHRAGRDDGQRLPGERGGRRRRPSRVGKRRHRVLRAVGDGGSSSVAEPARPGRARALRRGQVRARRGEGGVRRADARRRARDVGRSRTSRSFRRGAGRAEARTARRTSPTPASSRSSSTTSPRAPGERFAHVERFVLRRAACPSTPRRGRNTNSRSRKSRPCSRRWS